MTVGYRFGNLIVRKDVYYPRKRRRYWYVSCDICSKDKELFPNLFKTNKQQVEAGILPCGCSKSVRWSSDQYRVKIQRECDSSGLIIYDLPDKILSKSTITLKSVEGILWNVVVSNFLKGVRPKWFKRAAKTKIKTALEKYSTSNIKILRGKDGSYYEQCFVCKDDEYSSIGLRTEFKTTKDNLRNNTRMCRCNPKHHKLLYEWQILLKRKINDLGGVFLGIEDFDKCKTNSWVYYLCRKGTVTRSRLYNLWWGNRWCRCCSLINTTHYLYVVLWEFEKGMVWGKYGITSKPPRERCEQQNKKSPHNLKYSFYKVWEFTDYKLAKYAEDSLKSLNLTAVPSRSEFPDGYTETFLPTPINLKTIEGVLKSYRLLPKEGQC